MKLKLDLKSYRWWYWFITLIALIMGVFGISDAFYFAIILSAVQFIHLTARCGLTSIPSQVRLVYGILLVIALYVPYNILYWLLSLGTIMVVLFDRCSIQALLIKAPWNKGKDVYC